jgi:hypothetical protein
MFFRMYVRWKLRGLPVKAWRIRAQTTSGFSTIVRWQWICEMKNEDKYRSTSSYVSRWIAADSMRTGLRQALGNGKKPKTFGNLRDE